jgi:hypothetical protein
VARNKPGRPRNEPGEQRTSATRATLTLVEKQELELEARLQGVSEAEYVRRRLGFGEPAPGIRSATSIVSELEKRGIDVAAWLASDPVQQYATEAGVSEAVFVRRLLEFAAAPPASRERAALVRELNCIGVNINQLSRATHRGADFTRYWREIGEKLEDILERLFDHD